MSIVGRKLMGRVLTGQGTILLSGGKWFAVAEIDREWSGGEPEKVNYVAIGATKDEAEATLRRRVAEKEEGWSW